MARLIDFSDGFVSATEPTTGDLDITGNVSITGDLTVSGTTVTLNTQTLDVEDLNITINRDGNDASADGAGLTVDRTSTQGSLVYDSTKTSKWKLGNIGAEIEVVTVSGSQTLTNKTLTSPVVNTPTGIVKGDVGLGNVDNTSDATKNAASVTLTNKTLTSPVLTTPSFDILTATEQGSTPSSPSAGSRKIYVKDDGKAYLLNSSGTETALGSGGAGGINYLSTNPDAETSTSGWATYADAAASSPVDGTGGSPSSTYTRSTSSPLRGAASFLWTKSAANRQGEGFSYDFTIDAADKAKVLQISFDYLVSSGTYADSDMTVWIYDVTNAALIQPAGYTIQNASVSMKQLASFQSASNSTSYRLIVHTASTSALAYTLQFDNFSVGPQIVTNGAAITDWQSYTPTFGGTGVSIGNGTVVGKYKRVGDSLKLSINMTAGSTTAFGSGYFTFSLPSGLTIDTSKMADTSGGVALRGFARAYDNSYSGGYLGAGAYYNSTNVTANFQFNNAFTGLQPTRFDGNGIAYANFPFTWATSDTLEIEITDLPIVGWSSNVQLSSDTDTRVVAMRAFKNGGTLGTTGAFETVASYSTGGTSFDTHGGFNATTGIYTVPVSGKYLVAWNISLNGNASGVGFSAALKSSTLICYGSSTPNNTSTGIVTTGSCLVDCVAGDTLKIQGWQNSAATLAYQSTDNGTQLNIERLSGPSVIAASESVSALYIASPPTGTLTNAYNTTTFGTKVKDTHNAYSSGTYTVPVSGCYSISAETRQLATYSLGKFAVIAVYVDGVEKANGALEAAGANTILYPAVNVHSLPLLAGQLVTIKCYNDATTPTFGAAPTQNYFSIVRTGQY
jgi:hypothetical protein